MKQFFKYAVAASLLSAPVFVDSAHAQTQVNSGIILQASLDNSAYAGFVLPGTFTITMVNNFQGVPALAANSFRIHAVLPPGMQFTPGYTPPTGWNVTYLNNQEINLVPTAPLSNVFDLFGPSPNTATFAVPVTTQAAVNAESFFAEILPIGLTYQFSNYQIPSGVVSVANNPLPVDFKEFTATAEGCKVVLNWTTAVEKNNSHFVIERSNNSTSYTAIGRTNGAGTSFELNSYTYVDEKPTANHNFYRIRQVDFDGASTTSEVANAKVNCDNTGISIYPNPANNAVYVKGLTDKSTIEVYNVVGQKVVSKIAENTLEAVNLSGLAEGVYQVQVVTAGEIVYSTKLIKK